jgi:hypothetical protein
VLVPGEMIARGCCRRHPGQTDLPRSAPPWVLRVRPRFGGCGAALDDDRVRASRYVRRHLV